MADPEKWVNDLPDDYLAFLTEIVRLMRLDPSLDPSVAESFFNTQQNAISAYLRGTVDEKALPYWTQYQSAAVPFTDTKTGVSIPQSWTYSAPTLAREAAASYVNYFAKKEAYDEEQRQRTARTKTQQFLATHPEGQTGLTDADYAKQSSLYQQGLLGGVLEPSQPANPEIPPIPAAYPFIQQFLDTQGSNIGSYIQSKLSSQSSAIAQARQAWWEALNTPTANERQLAATGANRAQTVNELQGAQTATAGQLGVSPESVEQFYTPQIQAAQEESSGAGRELASQKAFRLSTKDPLQAYLSDYPWEEEFLKLPARERGFYPSRFAPQTRWR